MLSTTPGRLILGNVIVMIMLVAVVVLAALWQPVRLGAALLAGAAIPMVAQAFSAIAQLAGGTSPRTSGSRME